MEKQVERHHYNFSRYVHKRRWASMWHQLHEVLSLEPDTVLEIGPGPGVFKSLAGLFGVKVQTLDLDPELAPDHVMSADAMSFPDGKYDVVCAFQMLEHVPYSKSLSIFTEMARVAAKAIVISLPDARPGWYYSLHLPLKGTIRYVLERPFFSHKEHSFDGEHYWELNKKGYSVAKVTRDLIQAAPSMQLLNSYRVHEFPYHRFFVFLK